MNTHFIELLYPPHDESPLDMYRVAYPITERCINPWSILKGAVEDLSIPKGAVGYRYFDLEIDYNSNPPTPLGHPTNMSSIVYFGTIYSLDEVIKEHPHISPLYFYLPWFGGGKPFFVKTKEGFYAPLMEGDIVMYI